MAKKYQTLAEFLKGTGLTQTEFAERIGVQQSAVSRIVNGERTPSLALAMRIAAEANIPLDSLIPKNGEAA